MLNLLKIDIIININILREIYGRKDLIEVHLPVGSYYKTETQICDFLGLCPNCQVICNDGKRLYYGFENRDKNND